MPTYAYQCSECEHALEAVQKMADARLLTCPQCNKDSLLRIPTTTGLSFARGGDGFYSNMYGSKRPQETESTASSAPACCPCGKEKSSCTAS